MADDYMAWVLHTQHVDAVFAGWPPNDRVFGRGRVIAYADEPTLIIRRDDGTTFSWLARLCRQSLAPDIVPAAGDTPSPEIDEVDPAVAEVPLGILSEGEAAALEDFTLALAAADRRWSVAVGDQDMEPAYIRTVAAALWQLWARPTLTKREAELADAKDLAKRRGQQLNDLAEKRRQQLNHQASGYVRNLNEVRQQCDAEVRRLRELVGDEDVDLQWAGVDRATVIARAEEHHAEAEQLRTDRAAMWELFKDAVRMYRQNDEEALAEWRAEVADRDAEIKRLRQELDLIAADRRLVFGFDGSKANDGVVVMVMQSMDTAELERLRHELAGAMAAIAVAVELPVGHDPDELIEALAGVVAERDQLRSDAAVFDDVRERIAALARRAGVEAVIVSG